ncbi:acyl-CoA synthetase (AMP-forming)/AMP-acid ligase II [Cytobacillus eiseniae]|uniref:Acyl-CoA synthetase (AMP-forming)/AMP-acid ligase II n=1 Tax=Cytobacillus eiseniae TaxID=762947 RepID=A0ABS4RBD2_9BACI|nr:AMP-binding protein [Cytobacillus eiseniae]MBP2239655.1 acyl-CoA synthetase (AMP-forming)/AMP-acid ligase II [Cytobacillus eiseniae]
MGITIHGVLERNARKYPNKEAFITSTRRLFYKDMNQISNQIARLLQEKGIKKGDRVAIMARNNEHFFFAYFSLMKIGAIPMPINIRLTPSELVVIFQNSNAAGVLYESEVQATVDAIADLYGFAHQVSIQEAVETSASYSDENINIPIQSSEISEILFTSGTTGIPKGVVFNHDQLIALATTVSIEFSLSNEDKMLTLMPLTHSAPINTFFLSGLYCGASHVISEFTPKNFLQLIDQEKPTFAFAAPVAYLLASKDPELATYDLSSIRAFAYGGGPLALASYERVKEAFKNENFYQVYGLTEAGPNGILLRPHEHLTKAGSIGKHPTVSMELRIVHANGEETAPHEFGEVLLKGDSMMLEYDQNPEETSATIKDGWIYTGDIAYRDEDGYIYIVDRKKDVIISGGVNIYPREIEEVLAKHPNILESCVIGVPNEEWGETVKAVIVAKDELDEIELREFVSPFLADYKRPRQYTFVEELPRNASGKILKQKVKTMV